MAAKKRTSREGAKKKRVRIGIFSLSACAGCQFQVLFSDALIKFSEDYELINFELAKERNEDHEVDIAFVEGCVALSTEITKLKKIRKNAKMLVALGTCATYGGIPAIRDFYKGWEIERIVYPKGLEKTSEPIKASPIDEYVQVDHYLYGCPIDIVDFTNAFSQLLKGIIPKKSAAPVCRECIAKGNVCLLREYGLPCLGPVTHCGCDAVCTTNGVICEGCRGPIEEGNVDALINLLERTHPKEEIDRMLVKFAGLSKQFRKHISEK